MDLEKAGTDPQSSLQLCSTHCSKPKPCCGCFSTFLWLPRGYFTRDRYEAPEGLPFSWPCSKASLTKMNLFPGLWEHPRFQAETGFMPVLCSRSCPFNAWEQLICLSLSQFFPSFLPQDSLLTPTFLPSFSPAQLSLPCEGLPLLQLFAWSHIIPSKCFFEGSWH